MPHRPRDKGRGAGIKPSDARTKDGANNRAPKDGNAAKAQGNGQGRQTKSPVRASQRRRG
nr:MAG TPA: hypothetical protein [Caudoviricetes sp.]